MKPRAAIPSIVALLVLTSALATKAADKTIVLKAARLFDGKSKALVQNGVVIIEGNKIVHAGSNLSAPADAQVIDLGDATLSPGFMDGHTHLAHDFTNYNRERMEQLDLNVSEKALRATWHARATVEAGFTTVRDLGSRFPNSKEMVDVALPADRAAGPWRRPMQQHERLSRTLPNIEGPYPVHIDILSLVHNHHPVLSLQKPLRRAIFS